MISVLASSEVDHGSGWVKPRLIKLVFAKLSTQHYTTQTQSYLNYRSRFNPLTSDQRTPPSDAY